MKVACEQDRKEGKASQRSLYLLWRVSSSSGSEGSSHRRLEKSQLPAALRRRSHGFSPGRFVFERANIHLVSNWCRVRRLSNPPAARKTLSKAAWEIRPTAPRRWCVGWQICGIIRLGEYILNGVFQIRLCIAQNAYLRQHSI